MSKKTRTIVGKKTNYKNNFLQVKCVYKKNGKNGGKSNEKIMEIYWKIMVRYIAKRTRGQKVDLSCR